ncbi:YitT family protein [Bacillus sp. CGMCC 1.16607]|uniref:YczE/YyaS/YitT family protein n=1 Tax=Bacillus sp. CGMCC 1.16607 TaxID=3351842 RepID=UPI00363B5789
MPFIYRISFWIIGIVILSFGASLTIKANIGAGAWDALNVGLSRITGFTIGTFVIVIGIILMFVNAFLLKRRPDFLALFTIFFIGTLIDFWMIVILSGLEPSTFIVKALILMVGLLIIGFGVAIYLQPKFPLNPLDNFMMAISKRLGVNLVVAKTLGELLALVLALVVKGPIGIGTLIVTIGIGPSIQLFHPFFEKLAARLSVDNRKPTI